MKKILFAAMAAIIMCSAFVGFKTIRSDANNYIIMNPEELTVDPPIGGADLTFLYPINITTDVADVSAWECKLLWDPFVLRPSLDNESKPIIVWGTFMNGSNNCDLNKMASSGGEYIVIGQNFNNETLGITGSGWLASVNFTFVLPGATFVRVLNAKVWDNGLNLTPMSGIDGRVKSDRPHPQFWWWTEDTDNYGNITEGTHGTGPLPDHEVSDGGRMLPYATTVYFTGNFSYDVSNMVWSGTAYVLTGGDGITKYRWEYGDGEVDEYFGGNLTYLTDHVYADYSQAGYLVNLTVWGGGGASDCWSSTWRFAGPSPDDTVPMWRDVGIVDIWPSLIPYQNWDEYDDDWYSYWWYDSTDFYIPHTNDPYWNYNMTDLYCYYYGLPNKDMRLWPIQAPYSVGSRVKPTDTDVGRNLTKFIANEKWYDQDVDVAYGENDSIVHLVNASLTTFNSTLGDIVLNGPAVADGSAVSAFKSYQRYYDADLSGNYSAGEHVYRDYVTMGKVSGDTTTVKQAWNMLGNSPSLDYGDEGPGLNILVTANNYGSVPEDCIINLYAIGESLKNSGVSPAFAPLQAMSVEQIGTWTWTIGAGAGTGWALTVNWLPPKNATYVLIATIDIADGASIDDQNRADNYFVLTTPLSNIGAFNKTALSMVPAGWMNAKYMADLAKGGDGGVGSADLTFFLSQYGNNAKATPYQAPLTKP